MKKDFIYLASASPRRRELLEQIGVPIRIQPAGLAERPEPGEAPRRFVARMAREKAQAVWQAVAADRRPVLAADTVVVLEGRIFGKPSDAPHAEAMLAQLSGTPHQVLTSVAVIWDGEIADCLSITDVRLRATTPAERRAYAATGEPLDKAGGYGIQGLGAVFVESLGGSYSGVVGLPLAETSTLLQRFGLPGWLEGNK
jgi:septum formation protein